MLAPGDAIDVGYFWFADGDFHVMSDVDGADHLSVFHAIVEASGLTPAEVLAISLQATIWKTC